MFPPRRPRHFGSHPGLARHSADIIIRGEPGPRRPAHTNETHTQCRSEGSHLTPRCEDIGPSRGFIKHLRSGASCVRQILSVAYILSGRCSSPP